MASTRGGGPSAILRVMFGFSCAIMAFVFLAPDEQRRVRKPVVSTEDVYDIGAEQVAGYTCGEYEVNPCSPLGGSCSAAGFLDMGSTCECDTGFQDRSEYCDWGPIPSTYGGSTWSIEKLERVLLAYTAANVVYYGGNGTNGTGAWLEADGTNTDTTFASYYRDEMLATDDPSWYGEFYVNVDNGNSDAEWFQMCPSMQQQYSKFDQYKFVDDPLKDNVHVGVGKLKAGATSPSGSEEMVVAFGGTFSADTPQGEYYQVFTDLQLTPHHLKWNSSDGVEHDLGFVHYGFYSSLAPIMGPLIAEIKYNVPDSGIVTITGHSLGAAEATIFAAVLATALPQLDVHLVTFGTPRAGTPSFVKALNETGISQLRVVNEIDLITQIPTSIGLGDGVLQAGPQVTLNFTGVSSNCRDWFVTSQWMALLELPGTVWSGCPYEALMDHLGYQYNIVEWLHSHGLVDAALTCTQYTF